LIVYIVFCGYFLSTLLTFWLACIDNMRATGTSSVYGIRDSNAPQPRAFLFYFPKLLIAVPTAVLIMLNIFYLELKISEDSTSDIKDEFSLQLDHL